MMADHTAVCDQHGDHQAVVTAMVLPRNAEANE